MLVRSMIPPPRRNALNLKLHNLLVNTIQNNNSHAWGKGIHTSRNRRIVLRTVVAEGVLKVQAPPAMTFLHPRHFQIPAASRFTESFPQNSMSIPILTGGITAQVYFAC